MANNIFPRAVLFDLLTALLNSWTVWNAVAGSETAGAAWRAEYLRLTYGCGAYVPYEQLVRAAAHTAGLPDTAADALTARWQELAAWNGTQEVLDALQDRTKLAVVTNCSQRLGALAAGRLKTSWDCVVTAEEAGYYKPDPRPYRLALTRLGVPATEAAFSPGPATTCSAPAPSASARIGTTASGLSVPTARRHRISNRRPSTN
jgi:2-haloacid dehalogenase